MGKKLGIAQANKRLFRKLRGHNLDSVSTEGTNWKKPKFYMLSLGEQIPNSLLFGPPDGARKEKGDKGVTTY